MMSVSRVASDTCPNQRRKIRGPCDSSRCPSSHQPAPARTLLCPLGAPALQVQHGDKGILAEQTCVAVRCLARAPRRAHARRVSGDRCCSLKWLLRASLFFSKLSQRIELDTADVCKTPPLLTTRRCSLTGTSHARSTSNATDLCNRLTDKTTR